MEHNSDKVSASGGDEITPSDMDFDLLEAMLFEQINEYRKRKRKNGLKYSEDLQLINNNYTKQFSYRKFNGMSSSSPKLNKSLRLIIPKTTFYGRIANMFSGHVAIVDYKGRKQFYYEKKDDETDYRLFYGKRSHLKDSTIKVVPIPLLSYEEFAQYVMKKVFKGRGKREMKSSAYTHMACEVFVIEKTLFRKKIPMAVVVITFGGNRINSKSGANQVVMRTY